MGSILQITKVTKSYGTKILFKDLDLNINEGDKVALIAPNGTGKSSLLKIVAGKDTPDINANGESGVIQLFNSNGIGYLEQDPIFNLDNSVFEEVYTGDSELSKITAKYEIAINNSDTKELEKAIAEMDRVDGWQYELRIKQILSSLKIPDLNQKISQLSGGQKKRVALAKMIINQCNFIVLDEPTNHLDLETIEYLEEYLKRGKMTILMVTHDRYFLDRVCNKIIELDRGEIYTYNGNYSYFLDKKEERIENFNTETERARNLYKTELDWMRRMPQARATKAKYRINAFYDLQERAHQKIDQKEMQIDTQTARLGSKIINCKNVSHNYDSIVTLKNFSYNFSKGEKIGLVGPNGVGKSTFLDIITSNLNPSFGTIDKGETVIFGFYRQNGINFNEDDTVIDAVREIAEVVTMSDGSTINVSQILSRFLFPHSMHNTKISKLSGGEKRRLYLVTVLMKNPNFLILDEPTNDLDIMTLNILEEYLDNFPGCAIIVSHDRYFLDKTADHLFIFEGDGIIKDFVGKYSEYREYIKLSTKEAESSKQSINKKELYNSQKEIKQKITYKERIELSNLEEQIERLQKEKSSLEAALSNSAQYNSEQLTQISNKYSLLLEDLDNKEFRWLELSEKV